jgi:hypothetical protein
MSVNIRYPNITASTPTEQLAQIRSYLHQLVEELNYALPLLGEGDGTGSTTSSYEVQGEDVSYYELRSLIIQELQEVETMFDQLSAKMQSEYVSDSELDLLVGDLANLLTKRKDNLVAAINEIAKKPSGGLEITDDGEGNVVITFTPSISITDDGYGNVVIA